MRTLLDTIARIAAAQHGRVAHRQLVEAGVDRDRIKRWTADGRLRRVHRGVYAVGHRAPSENADLMAAVLAGGPGAVASHRSAAHLLALVRSGPPRPEITVPSTSGRRRPAIVVHRVRALPTRDIARWQGIPITTVPRTLLDLALHLPSAELDRACHEAWVRHGTTPLAVRACIARNKTKNGAARLLVSLLADVTLSMLEDGFLALLDAHDLERPRTNIDVAGDKVDCHWPHHGLTIELLRYRFHATRHAFEVDVARRRRPRHVAFTYRGHL